MKQLHPDITPEDLLDEVMQALQAAVDPVVAGYNLAALGIGLNLTAVLGEPSDGGTAMYCVSTSMNLSEEDLRMALLTTLAEPETNEVTH